MPEVETKANNPIDSHQYQQFSTFRVAERMFGIDVISVQEVVKPMTMTSIPLSPHYVHGLINLRGQVVTAIGLHELFGISNNNSEPANLMNVICNYEGALISLLVDEIGDVIEVESKDYEETPATVAKEMRQFMQGVYKNKNDLLSIIDIDMVGKILNNSQ